MKTWREAHEAYQELLDEVYPSCTVGALNFPPSQVLRELDPIAYREGLLNFIDIEGIDSDDLEGNDY